MNTTELIEHLNKTLEWHDCDDFMNVGVNRQEIYLMKSGLELLRRNEQREFAIANRDIHDVELIGS